jgi:hypothetical protein
MSSYQSEETIKDDVDEAMVKARIASIKKELREEVLKCLLPKLLLQDDFSGLVDAAYKIDRRKIVIDSFREMADLIERELTLEFIKGGYFGKED